MARVGVFVCQCGKNIASVVDVEKVVEEAKALPAVVHAGTLQYSCSDLGQKAIRDAVDAHRLDRVVLAACTPRMHEGTFQKCIADAGLNPYLFEMVNIREQCSWVHPENALSTAKAIRLVKMGVAKASRLSALDPLKFPVEKRVLVIGGGIAGMQAALDIGNAGYNVTVVEKSPSIGGTMALLEKTFPTLDCSA
jgi:heterodisulfide reductase subunit A2